MMSQTQIAQEQVEHPRYAILPSPEKLDESYNLRGRDVTNTRRDLNDVCKWAREAGFINTEFHFDVMCDKNQLLEKLAYNSIIDFVFGSAVDPIRDTYFVEKDELMLLYYAGHGLDGQSANMLNADLPNGQSSSPLLHNHYFNIAENRTSDRTVKGGELCLHHFGFCDLEGLLTPWMAAVNEQSRNADVPGVKKNKHLVVIADSCYSGVLVQDLQQLQATRSGPWNANGCTVTVQSACGSDELTVGGYFTPVFIHLNENPQVLQDLKSEWSQMSTAVKNEHRQNRSLPSPQVAPIRQLTQGNDPTMVLSHGENFKLTLFHDPGFFKFCFKSLVEDGVIASTGADAQTVQSRLNERSTWMAKYLQAMQQNH